MVAVAGVALVVGFFGEKFFGLPGSVALGFYLLSYLAGGYDVARAALTALFRGKFDIDLPPFSWALLKRHVVEC